jgi:hypothetical protein
MRNSPVWPESGVDLPTSRDGHLLADYAVNGSVTMTQLVKGTIRDIWFANINAGADARPLLLF